MGYYTGNGSTSGGGMQTRLLKSFYEWGAFAVRQKSRTSTNVKHGVSIETAQDAVNSSSYDDKLTAVSGGSGTLAWIIYDAEGTRYTVSYSQINGSNLYDLVVTTETLNAYFSSNSTRYIT